MRIAAGSVLLAALAAAGCAGVRVYSDPALKHETGIRVYTPKPYLLVSRTSVKDVPIASIVYLPDPSDVLYIRQHRGWGSSDLSVGVSNGMLTAIGSKIDAGGAETTTALAALLKAATAAYADIRPQATAPDAEAAFELYEIRQTGGRTVLVPVALERSSRSR